MKNDHFMPAAYTLYLTHKAMGIFCIIHWGHHVRFLACLHPIDRHCHKPHQQAFLLPIKGLGIYLFNYLYGTFWYTVFHILLLPYSTTTKKKNGQ